MKDEDWPRFDRIYDCACKTCLFASIKAFDLAKKIYLFKSISRSFFLN